MCKFWCPCSFQRITGQVMYVGQGGEDGLLASCGKILGISIGVVLVTLQVWPFEAEGKIKKYQKIINIYIFFIFPSRKLIFTFFIFVELVDDPRRRTGFSPNRWLKRRWGQKVGFPWRSWRLVTRAMWRGHPCCLVKGRQCWKNGVLPISFPHLPVCKKM